MNEKAMRERLENESERLAARENERVRTRVIESSFDSRILYIFLKASEPMAVAAAADAVAW